MAPPCAAVLPALRLVRPGNVLVSFVGTVVGALVARGAGLAGPASFFEFAGLAGLSAALVTAGGNVLNDVLDVAGDRVNHPDRPLVTGAVSLPTARLLCAILLLGSVIAILPIVTSAIWLAPILGLALAAVLAYELRFKARGLPGNALVAFLTAEVFLYGGAAAGSPLLLVPFAGMAFAATFSRELIKDMEDAGGDVDRATLPRTHGFPLASALARGAVVVAIGLSPVPLLAFVPIGSIAGIIYLALVAATDAVFVLSVSRLPEQLHREQTLSKRAMTIALLAFVATAFR